MSEQEEPKPTCKDCRAFQVVESYVGVATNPHKVTSAQCRRHPPIAGSGWPSVQADDWCMEHQPHPGKFDASRLVG